MKFQEADKMLDWIDDIFRHQKRIIEVDCMDHRFAVIEEKTCDVLFDEDNIRDLIKQAMKEAKCK